MDIRSFKHLVWLVLVICAPVTAADENAGSDAGRHWAFQPVSRVEPPAGTGDTASDHPIDRFIRARQADLGVTPVPPADRRTLIRRATFDLTGLPPTPKEVRDFLEDDEPGAFARVVDRLLASPRYGERWGRHWLDLARYADTAGENSDYPIPQAYLYRDWVIDAFNADKPYDVFLREQIAGDILAKRGPDDEYAQLVIATGFLAQAKRFGTNKLEDMHLIIEDNIHTIGQVVLGLSLRCARCHDHKHEPVTMEDYYALYGFFQSTSYPFPGGESDKQPSEFAPLISEAQLAKQDAAYAARHEAEVKRIEDELAALEAESPQARRVEDVRGTIAAARASLDEADGKGGEAAALKQRLDELEKELAAAEKQLEAGRRELESRLKAIDRGKPSRNVPLGYAVREGKPADAAIQKGGEPGEKGATVPRGVPAFLDRGGGIDVQPGSSGRLQLADWLTSADNPLTARVMVNRIWQHHFGKPIVATPSDFGLRGAPPTHPQLLDWLAGEFMRSGWSIKTMHRTIMLSQAYRRASSHDAANARKDGGNALYWRFDRRRLDAEAIRDAMLTLGGSLELDRPGPHPFPPQDKWSFSAHRQFKAVYPSNHRSVYLMVQRLHPHPYLSMFNGPDTSMTTPMRDSSTVAKQALFMLNSEFVHEQAAGLAGQLIEATDEPRQRVHIAFERVLSRPARDAEADRLLAHVDAYRKAMEEEGIDAQRQEREAWTSVARVLLTSNEFLYVD